MSFVFDVWLANEVFDPKMSLIEKYVVFFFKNIEIIWQNSFSEVFNILRQSCIFITFDDQRKML